VEVSDHLHTLTILSQGESPPLIPIGEEAVLAPTPV